LARPRKSVSDQKLSPGQASYVLDRLIGDRRVTRTDVQRYVNDMHREIGDLERRLQSLKEAAGSAIRSAIQALTPGKRRGRPPGGGKKRRSAKITAEQLASRQLQGRYLGLIRQIPASKRGTYQKIAKEKGREAAIKEMMTTLKK
jgi:O6-methylguanine-DNA--protein-cysteine methyltransferase